MSYVLAFSNDRWTLATDRLVLPADDVPTFQDALTMVSHIEALAEQEQNRIQAAVEEGYRKGYAQGQEDGAEVARREAAEALALRLDALVRQGEADRVHLQRAVSDVVGVVLRMVLAQLPAMDVLESLVTKALQSVDPDLPVTVRVHTAMAGGLEERLHRLPHAKLVVEASEDLERYGCEVLTPAGRLLAGLEDQLMAVQAMLQSVRTRQLQPGASGVEKEGRL